MKALLVIFFSCWIECIAVLNTGWNQNTTIEVSDITSEVIWYINKVKPESPRGGKNNIYLLKLYRQGNEPCLTVGYIFDFSGLAKIQSKYLRYIKLGEEIILVDVSPESKNHFDIKSMDLNPINDDIKISDRLTKDVSLYSFPTYVCHFDNGNISKKFYINPRDVPASERIYPY